MYDIVPNYVDGRLIESISAESTELIDPTTGRPDGRSPISTQAELDAAYAAADRAFTSWRSVTPRHRQEVLLTVADAVAAHRDELAELQSRDTGQLTHFVASEEIDLGVDHLRFFAGAARMLGGIASGEYLEGHTSSVRREPVGVIGQVTPWNYPLSMAFWKIAPALAAGNTVVLKPSDTTPRSTVRLAEIAGDALPPGTFNVVNGDAGVGRLLVEHPTPAMVAITGSVRAGIAVASSAAPSLKRVHLELGGKAPAVVRADIDLQKAADAIASAAFFNAGQDCTAATRVIVHDSVHDDLVAALVAAAAGNRPGRPDDPGAAYGPLNNARHFERVQAFLAELPAHATVATGGTRWGTEGFYLEPTVVTGVRQNDRIVQEEVFGPVLTVQSHSNDAQAIDLANGVRYGLAASVWTTDHSAAERFSRELDFGCVWVNTHLPFLSEMPHGGFGASGYGKDLSMFSLEDYTRVKHVMSAHG